MLAKEGEAGLVQACFCAFEMSFHPVSDSSTKRKSENRWRMIQALQLRWSGEMKRILLLLFALIMLVTGCARQANNPPTVAPGGEAPVALPAERQISLHKLNYQGQELAAVFRDFTGVSALTLNQSGLSYIQDKALWSSDFSGKHELMHQEPAQTYEKWYQEISALHEAERKKEVQPDFEDVTGKYLDRYNLLAYSEARNLVLAHASGAEKILAENAGDLELLGWMDNTLLVFYADLPGHGKNVYTIDAWDEVVAFNSHYTNTLSLGSNRFSEVVASHAGHMWAYDENRVAYALGGKVYTIEQSGPSRVVTTPDEPLVRTERELMIFHDLESGTAPRMQYNGRTTVLRQSTAQMPMDVDWLNEKLYYVSEDEYGMGVSVIDLTSMEETDLFYAAEDFRLTCLALSPAGEELVFVQVQEIVPDDGPYNNYRNEVYRYDMISGHMLPLQGQGLHDRLMLHQFASAYWLKEDLIALGQRFDSSPGGEQPLSLHRITPAGNVSVSEQWDEHVELVSDDVNHIFLSDWASGGGWDERMACNIWYYDVANNLRARQLTGKHPWQIQQDKSLAFNEERGLLFISRLKGFLDQGYGYQQPIVHGVLVDLQGREYTLMSEDIRSIEQAVWMEDDLYVRLPGKIVRVTVGR